MFKITFAIIFVSAFSFAAPHLVPQKQKVYGPVVSAYLVGLAEELNELEYQLRHQEISRAEYERAKQRVILLRRYVERYAEARHEDRVPELHIITQDEFRTLGINADTKLEQLRIGDQLAGRWELIGIEGTRQPVFILEQLPQTARDRKLDQHVDPREVIETIVIRERPPQFPEPPPQPAPTTVSPQTTEPPAPVVEKRNEPVGPRPMPKPLFDPPRILHIYLPSYTEKARAKGIEGELTIRALFRRDGKIKSAKLEKGLGFGLDERALDAVKRIGFVPAQMRGKEIDAQTQLVFTFKLDKVTVIVAPFNPVKGVTP